MRYSHGPRKPWATTFRNRKVIDGFSNYLRQAALTDTNKLETVIRTIGLERDRAETEVQLLERQLANKETQLRELTSEHKDKGLKDYLEQVLENFDNQDDSKKRLIVHTIIPRIEILPKNKLRIHIRTDFRGETDPWGRHEHGKSDFGHGVSSYQPPAGMEQGGLDSVLGAVTPGGNSFLAIRSQGRFDRVWYPTS